ncbi:MAG: glucosaminidase domain-containing protein [Chitinophagaceae bacterium]|nr:glucosaminidase domain-containing protein [Chitinophagaceae bacterium]
MTRYYLVPLLILVLFSSCHRKLHKQRRATKHKLTTEEYIAAYKKIARKEMRKHGIPASITLAQGILESNSGNSELARRAHNHFGIKCTGDWNGRTYHVDDDKPNECFRRYKHAEASFHDHSDFLKRKRYEALFELDRDDYEGWAKGLKKAGYATNPKYPQLLINLIEKHKLYKYD